MPGASKAARKKSSSSTTEQKFAESIQKIGSNYDIEKLDLPDIKVDKNQATILATELKKLTKLQVLNLTNAGLNCKTGPIIAKDIPTSVKTLILNGTFTENTGIQSLAAKLKTCIHLDNLYLLNTPLKYSDVEIIERHCFTRNHDPLIFHISCTDIPKILNHTHWHTQTQKLGKNYQLTQYKPEATPVNTQAAVTPKSTSADIPTPEVTSSTSAPAADALSSPTILTTQQFDEVSLSGSDDSIDDPSADYGEVNPS